MAKPRVPIETKRIIISARVTPSERETLLAVGDGNISRGLDRIMIALSAVWEVAPEAQAPAIPPSA